MNGILGAIIFLAILIVLMVAVILFVLKGSSCAVSSSKYILNKFEPDNTAPKLTEMIDFHKNNENLSKYNIE